MSLETGGGLSAQAIAIMKATAPLVSEHKAAITTRFYEVLVKNHPEVKNLFNMSHLIKSEESGVSPLAMALANAVEAYAFNCDNLGVLTGSKSFSKLNDLVNLALILRS